MITDSKADTVYLSDKLAARYPQVEADLQAILAAHGIAVKILRGTKDVWCRDYMPIQVSQDRFVQFRYDPDYLRKHPHLRTDPMVVRPNLGRAEIQELKLVLDGGNVVRGPTAVIMTERIFRENPDRTRAEIGKELERLLEVDCLIFIPVEPGDECGHADGVARFVDDRTVLVNDYRKAAPAYGGKLHARLRKHGLELLPMPYSPTYEKRRDMPSATGCYINLLQTSHVVVVPQFGHPADAEALAVASSAFAGMPVKGLNCETLAPDGGVLNCITWTVCASSRLQG